MTVVAWIVEATWPACVDATRAHAPADAEIVLLHVTDPDAAGLGWAEVARLIDHCPLPVFTLGGMRPAMMADAWAHGAHGLALMRGWGPVRG